MRRATPILCVLAALLVSGHVQAQDEQRKVCIDAYEGNQTLRKDGKLSAAREQLLICVQQSCPDFVRPDCVRWLEEVDKLMPTVVVAAKGPDGSDTVAVGVFIDGRQVATQLDGRPIQIDPGPHEMRFEYAGVPPIARDVVIAQSVKDRLIEVSFKPVVPNGDDDDDDAPATAEDHGQPILAYVFLGLSVPAFVTFAVFGIMGKNEADVLNEECKPTCEQDKVDAVFRKLVIADVSLGIGCGLFAIGTGLFIYHFATAPDDDPAAVTWSVGPTIGGAAGQLSVPF